MTFGLENRKKFNFSKIYEKNVFIVQAKVVYLHTFLSFLPFLKFSKQNFMYFGRKHLETEPSCSHEHAIFFQVSHALKQAVFHFVAAKTIHRKKSMDAAALAFSYSSPTV